MRESKLKTWSRYALTFILVISLSNICWIGTARADTDEANVTEQTEVQNEKQAPDEQQAPDQEAPENQASTEQDSGQQAPDQKDQGQPASTPEEASLPQAQQAAQSEQGSQQPQSREASINEVEQLSENGELTKDVIENRLGGDIKQGQIDFEYFKFQCDSATDESQKDLSNDVSKALGDKGYIESGMVSQVLPQVLQANNSSHVIAKVSVGGVQVYSIGTLEIQGVTYVYYITDEVPDDMTVYSVLPVDANAANQTVSTPGKQILVEYRHTDAYTVDYEIQDENGVHQETIGGSTLDDIFGTTRPTVAEAPTGTKTANYSVSVNIPRGYAATVYAYNVNDNGQTNGEPVSTLKLGYMPKYSDQLDSSETVQLAAGESPFKLSDILDVSGISQNQKIVIQYKKFDQYQFSADVWYNQSKSVTDGNERYIESSGATTGNITGNTFAWTFYGNTTYDGNMYCSYALSEMSLNGESITVPIIATGEKGTVTRETTLSTGTKVTLSVKYEDPDNTEDGTKGVRRVYELKVSDCYEDITVTSGGVTMQITPEIIMESLHGVENSQVFDFVQHSWVEKGQGSLAGRGINVSSPQLIYMPFSFYRSQGYYEPNVTITLKNGEKLVNDEAVDFLVLKSGKSVEDLAQDGSNFNDIFQVVKHDELHKDDSMAEMLGTSHAHYFRLNQKIVDQLSAGIYNMDPNYRPIRISIDAQPIKGAVAYQNGEGNDTTGPLADNIDNMPADDNGGDEGYNNETNNRVHLPNTVPVDTSGKFTFVGWEVLEVQNGSTLTENVHKVNGEDLILLPGAEFNLDSALESTLFENCFLYPNDTEGTNPDSRVKVTLRAKWQEIQKGDPLNYYVNYYLDGKLIHDCNHTANDGATLAIKILEGEGENLYFTQTVKDILQGDNYTNTNYVASAGGNDIQPQKVVVKGEGGDKGSEFSYEAIKANKGILVDKLDSKHDEIDIYLQTMIPVKYEFQSGTEEMELPEGVTSQLSNNNPSGTVPYLENGPVNNELKDQTYNQVKQAGTGGDQGSTRGHWDFQGWSPDSPATISGRDSSVTFIGTWKFTKTYDVKFSFAKQTGTTLDLPPAVTDQLSQFPGQTIDENGSVTLTDPQNKEIKVDEGTWTFVGWFVDDNPISGDSVTITKDTNIVGKWSFEYNVYDVTYAFESATAGVSIPGDLLSSNLPNPSKAEHGSTVYAPGNITESVYDGINHGTWTFKNWDPANQTVTGNVQFTGWWEFTRDQHEVTYRFEAASGSQHELPDVINTDEYLPASYKAEWGSKVSPADPRKTVYYDAKNLGYWTFDAGSWTPGNDTTVDANGVEFVGTWSYEADEYPVTHEFRVGNVKPTGQDVPEGVKLPTKIPQGLIDEWLPGDFLAKAGSKPEPDPNGVGPKYNKNLPLTEKWVDVENHGTWYFMGWSPDTVEVTNNLDANKFTGTWDFELDKYEISYVHQVVTQGADGVPELEDMVPEKGSKYYGFYVSIPDVTGGVIGEDETLKKGTTFEMHGGTYEFLGWFIGDKDVTKGFTVSDDIANDDDEIQVVGRWAYTPSYDVTYTFVSGTSQEDMPEGMTNELPGSITSQEPQGENYAEGSTVEPLQPNPNTVAVPEGVWTFQHWVLDEDNNGKIDEGEDPVTSGVTVDGDKHFFGVWTFEPYQYSVSYEFTNGSTDQFGELPAEVMNRKPSTSRHDYNSDVTLEQMPVTVTVPEGTWTFGGWKIGGQGDVVSTIEDIKANIHLVGEWTFARNAYSVEYKFVSGTEGMELPGDVTSLTPTDDKKYDHGYAFNRNEDLKDVAEENKTVVVDDGRWEFKDWDEASIPSTITGPVTITGTWEYTKTYDVTYSFQRLNSYMPEFNSDLAKCYLPANTTVDIGSDINPYQQGEKKLINDVTTVRDDDNNGTWTFRYWSPTSVTDIDSSQHFTGYWAFELDKHKVTYKYDKVGEIPEGVNLPPTLTPPMAEQEYGHGSELNVPSVTSPVSDPSNHGTWTFEGWYDEQGKPVTNGTDVTVEQAMELTGKWSFAYDTHKVIYKFQAADTTLTLPEGIDFYLPKDDDSVAYGTQVTPEDLTGFTYKDEANHGTWMFEGWDPSGTQTMGDEDITFVGTWTFALNQYGVTYEFESVTLDKELPDSVKALMPSDDKLYDHGSTVTAADLSNKGPIADGKGEWNFIGWKDNGKALNITGPVTFVGQWQYTPSYDVSYEFAVGEGAGNRTLPEEVTKLLPGTENYSEGSAVEPAQPADTEVTVTDGTWRFVGWNPEKIDGITGAATFTGTWDFDVNKYAVDYEFVSEDGTALPDEVMALLPTDLTEYEHGTNVSVSNKLAKGETVTVPEGTWTFEGWDNDEITGISGPSTFTGTWSFKLNQYDVSYEFVSGTEDWELPSAVTDLEPATQQFAHGSSPMAQRPGKTQVTVPEGTWTFAGYDQDSYNEITGPITFKGTWTFEVNKYDVSYDFVSGTEGKDLPQEVMEQLPQPGTSDHGTPVKPENPAKTTVEVEDGTWTFGGYDSEGTDSITDDTTFTGKWTFAPYQYTVTYQFESMTLDKQLPQAVMDLLPVDGNKYNHGSNVDPVMPSVLEVNVENGGKWTFQGWTPGAVQSIAGNVTFTGKWIYTPSHNAKYTFVSGTEGKGLPDEVWALLPADQNFSEGAAVVPAQPTQTTVKVAGGTWTFQGWDPAGVDALMQDAIFKGTWVFVEDQSVIPANPPSGDETNLDKERKDKNPNGQGGNDNVVPKTNDSIPLGLVASLGMVAVVSLVVSVVSARRIRRNK